MPEETSARTAPPSAMPTPARPGGIRHHHPTKSSSSTTSTSSGLTLKRLLPASTERWLIVGTTGGGKTTLAKHGLRISKYPTILVIDPKCTYGGKTGEEGFTMVRRPDHLKRLSKREIHIQYRPDEKHNSVWDYDEVYHWAYRRQDIMVYTDETFAVMHRTFAPDWLRACVTQGRELHIGMIFATQRPRGVDLRVLTEAEVISMFELRYKEDRKRMAELMGEEVMTPLPRYAFWHWRTGMSRPVPARLKLK